MPRALLQGVRNKSTGSIGIEQEQDANACIVQEFHNRIYINTTNRVIHVYNTYCKQIIRVTLYDLFSFCRHMSAQRIHIARTFTKKALYPIFQQRVSGKYIHVSHDLRIICLFIILNSSVRSVSALQDKIKKAGRASIRASTAFYYMIVMVDCRCDPVLHASASSMRRLAHSLSVIRMLI